MGGNNEFFENFERNKYLKNLPSMQRVKGQFLQPIICLVTKWCPQKSCLCHFKNCNSLAVTPLLKKKYSAKDKYG